MKHLKKLTALLLCLILVGSGVMVYAEGTSHSYVYDSWDHAMSVSEPYTATTYLMGAATFGGTALKEPTDIFVRNNEEVYILDAAKTEGNNRVVVLTADGTFLREVRLTKDGQPVALKEAQGMFVTADGTLYITDKSAYDTKGTVYVAKPDGTVIGEVQAPPADVVEANFLYTPISVVVDTAGIIYVVSDGSENGALQYNEKYEYLGYFGAEQVTVTAEVLINEMWKNLLSEEATQGLKRNAPTSIKKLDIDPANFIFTLKGSEMGTGVGQVRKLNTLGTNIMFNNDKELAQFGDLDSWFDTSTNKTEGTDLIDLVADDRGFVTVLDQTHNRLFQYDENSNLLYAFGGKGDRYGNYAKPVAVDSCGDNLLVLDQKRNSVTILAPTAFACNVRSAIIDYNDGRYVDAGKYWKEVLKTDAYYELANIGMGAYYEAQGDRKTAMHYYELGNDKASYSACFTELRDEMVRANFPWILGGVVALLLGAVLLTKWSERRRVNEYNIQVSKWRYPLYCLLHPFKAYYELKIEKKGSMRLACASLLLFFFSGVVQEQFTAFHFVDGVKENFNIFLIMGTTIGLFVLFVLCNWAVSTLADGEGKLKEIFIFTSYALIPYTIGTFVLTGLSHMFSLEEAAFMGVLWVVVYAWTGIHLFMATREVHQYTSGKTVLLLGGSVLGIYLLLLLITIGYSLFAQLITFITTLYSEYRLH